MSASGEQASFLSGRDVCPYCGQRNLEPLELRVHCLWQHALKYIDDKRRQQEEVKPEEPPSKKRKDSTALADRVTNGVMLEQPQAMASSTTAPGPVLDAFRPCRVFPFCRGSCCPFLHPVCPVRACDRLTCIFFHPHRFPSRAPPAPKELIQCPHVKLMRCKAFAWCGKQARCEYQHEVCPGRPLCPGLDCCRKHHYNVPYFCDWCLRKATEWCDQP